MIEGWRPRRRADCVNVPRPCPYVGCRYNLHLERVASGHGRRAVDEDPTEVSPEESCALDIADRGPHTLEQVAAVVRATPKGVAVIIERATRRLRILQPLDEYVAGYERP